MPDLVTGATVTVRVPTFPRAVAAAPARSTVRVLPVAGPRGPGGTNGGGAFEHQQLTASAQWSIPVPAAFEGRRPAVAVYLNGEHVETDVTATAELVTITFPMPTPGTAVLT